MPIKYHFLKILGGPLVGPIVYYIGWYSLPIIVAFLMQDQILKRFGLGGYDTENVPDELEKEVSDQKFYRYVTYSHVYLYCASVIWSIWLIGTGVSLFWVAFLIIASGGAGGIAIVTGHELSHRTGKYESFLAGLALSFVSYATFKVEHVRGHHVTVSTPGDASSARLGQTIYNFLPQAVVRNVMNGFRLEAKRLKRLELPAIHWKNELIWWSLLSFSLAFAGYLYAGMAAAVFFVVQSLMAILSLEVINYVEHYGLERHQLPNGRYERVSPMHSWNASGRLQNSKMLNLMRHSDHHAHPTRRYQILKHWDDAPQLPRGYEYMINLAFYPKKWFRLMDPLATSHMEKLRALREEKGEAADFGTANA